MGKGGWREEWSSTNNVVSEDEGKCDNVGSEFGEKEDCFA